MAFNLVSFWRKNTTSAHTHCINSDILHLLPSSVTRIISHNAQETRANVEVMRTHNTTRIQRLYWRACCIAIQHWNGVNVELALCSSMQFHFQSHSRISPDAFKKFANLFPVELFRIELFSDVEHEKKKIVQFIYYILKYAYNSCYSQRCFFFIYFLSRLFIHLFASWSIIIHCVAVLCCQNQWQACKRRHCKYRLWWLLLYFYARWCQYSDTQSDIHTNCQRITIWACLWLNHYYRASIKYIGVKCMLGLLLR